MFYLTSNQNSQVKWFPTYPKNIIYVRVGTSNVSSYVLQASSEQTYDRLYKHRNNRLYNVILIISEENFSKIITSKFDLHDV